MVSQPRTVTQPSYHREGYNGSGSDIAAGYILAAGATPNEVELADAASDPIVGVSTETIYDGKTQSYQMGGKAWVYSGGAVSAGDALMADATGRAVTASVSASSTVSLLGRAVTAATGAGQKIEVELFSVMTAFVGSAMVSNRTALKAIAAASRFDGQQIHVQSDRSNWVFESSNAVSGDEAEALIVEPDTGSGRWVRNDAAAVLRLPFDYQTADGAALLTVPTGFCLRLTGLPFWDIDTALTGGSSSAIGVSTDVSGYETKGDVLGGASGDVEATLTAGIKPGTIGGELNDTTGLHDMILAAGTEVQFDRITSQFAAGAGNVCLPVAIMKEA